MPVSVLVAAGGAGWEARLLPTLSAPGAPARLARRCVDVPDLVAAAAAGRAGLALVSAGVAGWDADVVARLAECDVRTVVVADGSAEVERARRIGGSTVVTDDVATDPDRLLQVLLDAAAAREPAAAGIAAPAPAPAPTAAAASAAVDGRVVAVWGATGAPGRSTVALGLAAAAARRATPTLLLDLDVYGGATAQMLAVLDEVSGVLAATRAASAGSLDPTGLLAAARTVEPNLAVLTGLPRADRWTALRPAAVRELLAVARGCFPLVVVDCGFGIEQDEELSFDTAAPRRNGATVTALEQADLVLVVGSADPLSLTRLARASGDLRELVPTATTHLVVNRMRRGLGWSRDEVAGTVRRATGTAPLAFLPLDQPAVDRAWIAGRSLPEAAPTAPLSAALDRLYAELAAELEVGVLRR